MNPRRDARTDSGHTRSWWDVGERMLTPICSIHESILASLAFILARWPGVCARGSGVRKAADNVPIWTHLAEMWIRQARREGAIALPPVPHPVMASDALRAKYVSLPMASTRCYDPTALRPRSVRSSAVPSARNTGASPMPARPSGPTSSGWRSTGSRATRSPPAWLPGYLRTEEWNLAPAKTADESSVEGLRGHNACLCRLDPGRPLSDCRCDGLVVAPVRRNGRKVGPPLTDRRGSGTIESAVGC